MAHQPQPGQAHEAIKAYQKSYEEYCKSYSKLSKDLLQLMTALKNLDKALRKASWDADKKLGLGHILTSPFHFFGTHHKAENAETPMEKPEPSQAQAKEGNQQTSHDEHKDEEIVKWFSGTCKACDNFVRQALAESLHSQLLALGKEGAKEHVLHEWIEWCQKQELAKALHTPAQELGKAIEKAHGSAHEHEKAAEECREAWDTAQESAKEEHQKHVAEHQHQRPGEYRHPPDDNGHDQHASHQHGLHGANARHAENLNAPPYGNQHYPHERH